MRMRMAPVLMAPLRLVWVVCRVGFVVRVRVFGFRCRGVGSSVTSILRWRLRPLRGVATVWVVGPIGGVMALTPTIDGPLFEVRPARSSKSRSVGSLSFTTGLLGETVACGYGDAS